MPLTDEQERQRKAEYRARKSAEIGDVPVPPDNLVESAVRSNFDKGVSPLGFAIAIRVAQLLDNTK